MYTNLSENLTTFKLGSRLHIHEVYYDNCFIGIQ